MPTVAFVPWPCSDALLGALQARGSYVVALLAPDAWEQAFDAQRRGADDVLLEPASRQAFGVRAALARQILRQRRPAPWHRPRVVLREALAHPSGGDVLLRTESGTTRVLVSRGRVVWVHDDAGGSLLQELQSLGVRIDADELSEGVAECQRTRDHFVEVLARWYEHVLLRRPRSREIQPRPRAQGARPDRGAARRRALLSVPTASAGAAPTTGRSATLCRRAAASRS